MLNIDENEAFKLIAPSVLANYLLLDKDSRDIMMLSTVVKLTVENFALNVKLMQK